MTISNDWIICPLPASSVEPNSNQIQLYWLVEMSSLPFSIGSCTPKTLVTYSTTPVLNNPTKASRIRIPNQGQEIIPHQIHDKNSSTLFVRRREAIGFSFCFGLFDLLSQPKNADAAAAAICELTVAPSGLAFCDKVVGTGPEAVKGKLIKAHYVGKLENGTVFDSSYNRGSPLTFRIGVGEVIKGWDQGILGSDGVPPMLAGGKRTLKLPPELGYGVRGAGCRGGSCPIPPNAVLLFDVEFIG